MPEHRLVDHDLNRLRDKVLLIGGEAERAVAEAMQAFISRDSQRARAVVDHDDAIDAIELEIDDLCIDVLALRPPVAGDLRFVMTCARIAPVLERIADHACNVARHALALNLEPQVKPFIDLPEMGRLAVEMVHASMDAFATRDVSQARALILRDHRIDDLYNQIFRELLTYMIEDPRTISRATHLLFAAKHLERIADYVKNVCEQVVYMVEGRVIKHVGIE
ncbi:MAG: phosphate signaling complex protein PhoU [Acidobacteria bacterium]|nr:phosphate signaling complex protein PhoU [Acidobacteriota bacterium]